MIRVSLLVLSALTAAAPALAVDGVVEINQSRALAGGVTTTDTPGFPVTIDTAGSYRLTGNLSPPPATTGIDIDAADVTLDLNGHALLGGLGEFDSDGVQISGDHVEVRNGTIRDFVRHGVAGLDGDGQRVIDVRVSGMTTGDGIALFGGSYHLVDRCTSVGNGRYGVNVGPRSLVRSSVINDNTDRGLSGAADVAYVGNMLSNNNGGVANPQVSFATEIGGNYCGNDTVCP